MTGPKWSRGTLDVINNTFVVRNGLLFEYYPIAVRPYGKDDKFLQLEISPGIRSQGIACIAKKLYKVTLEDLERRRINVSKREGGDTARSTTSSTTSKGKSPKLKAVGNKQGSSKILGSNFSKAIDVAWENQIDSLLQNIAAKAGGQWEVSDNSQP